MVQARAHYPTRIISGMPSVTEMLFALGLDSQIIGVTTNCNYPTAAQRKDKIGGFFLNFEKINSLQPDLIVMLSPAQDKDIKKFKKFGLRVYSFSLNSVEDVFYQLLVLGTKTGHRAAAEKLVSHLRARLSATRQRIQRYRPNVGDVLAVWNPGKTKRQALVLVGVNPLIVAGGGTFVDDILKRAGVDNLAAKTSAAYPQYSLENLVKENPQYIIVPEGLISYQQMRQDKRWRSLEAVRQNRILFMDADILSRPGPRVVDAVEQIANFVYSPLATR